MKFKDAVDNSKIVNIESLNPNRRTTLKITYDNGLEAIARFKVKTKHGEDTKKGLPVESLIYRKMAFFNLDRLFGFNLCSESFLTDFKGKEVFLSHWITGESLLEFAPTLKYADRQSRAKSKTLLDSISQDELYKACIESLIACSRYAHAKSYMVSDSKDNLKKLWSVGNGVSFGLGFDLFYDTLYRTLFKLKLELPLKIANTLAKITKQDLEEALGGLINNLEIENTYRRIQYVLKANGSALGFDKLNKEKPSWYFEELNGVERKDEERSYVVNLHPPIAEDYGNYLGFIY